MSSDDEIEELSWKGIPATAIYINVYDPGNHKIAEVAHAATCLLMRQYLRTSSSQSIAVCFYGLESSNARFKTIEEVVPLALPTLDAFKKLHNINMSSFTPSKEFILSDVLWHSRQMFSSCKKQLLSRNVILLSRFDCPPSQMDHKKAFKEAVYLSDSGIEVKLVNISETDYTVDSFYTDFLINANKVQDVDLPKPVWNHKEIEQLLHQQCNRHLAVARLNFELGDGVAIGVGVYSLLKGKSQLKSTALDSETNAVLTTVNKTMKIKVDDDNAMEVDGEDIEDNKTKAMPLLKSEILYYQVFGGEKVQFEDHEMKTLRNPFGPPMLKLLGFKPAHILSKEKWIFKQSYFLFPNESLIDGSTVAFKALHRACTEINMVAICILCTRVNAKCSFVALSPCNKPLGLNVDIGFDVIRIPFKENIRNIPATDDDDEDINIPEPNKTVMKDILQDLKFDYKTEVFENPKLQSQYKAIEALAMADEELEPIVDTTRRDLTIFNAIKDDLFQELFGPFEASTAKRVTKSNDAPKAKKVKLDGLDDETLLNERLKHNQVNDYTVPQLRDILRSVEIPNLPALTGVKKNDLVDLVYKNFSLK